MIKVLIVEDDPMVAFINKQYLNKIGGIEAVGPVCTEEDIIKEMLDNKIDLILLDVFLPEKSGLEILKSLRSKKYIVDVIIISAANSPEELRKAFALGIVDYLIKPFQFDRFEEAVNKFKFKNNVLSKEHGLSQEDVDKLYVANKMSELPPKGLTRITLQNILNVFTNDEGRVWTLREIASEVSLSNVTVKKYMDYLEQIEKVNVEITYGNVGRPEYKYTLIT